ncbi:MAG: cytochrome c [Alphaproteobacteria bacterium]|nr:cytochrome c [Alphaproteobacteria bacterium]
MSDLPDFKTRTWLIAIAVGVIVLSVIGGAALYGGLFNVAADVPHGNAMYWLLETARERSIAVRATGIVVPDDLADPKRITSGAGQYAEMCSLCHLAPGMKRTEIARGLYPRAPDLKRGSKLSPAEQFWVIKHGIKLTGMPAWGLTHDDDVLWDVVAFLRKLPELTPEQYRSLVDSAPKTHDGH